VTANDVASSWQRFAAAQPVKYQGLAVDLLLVALIVGIVLVEALQTLEPVLAKTRVLNALSLARTEQIDAVEALAVRGVLPERATELAAFPAATPAAFAAPVWRDGELVLVAADERLQALGAGADAALAFRVARAPDSGATIWLCGGEQTPAGFEAKPPLHTTIPPRYLPHFCR
jgi:hypothetical protein